MKIRLLFAIVAILMLLSLPDVMAQSGAAKGKGRLKGEVADTDGKPLEGVTVRFYSPRLDTTFEVQTDSKGTWIVSGMAGGAWNIDFLKEGYKDRMISSQVTELSHNKDIEIKMEKKATVQEAAPKEKIPGVDLVEEAATLRESKDYAGAIAKYEEALQVNPALTAAYGDIARIYIDMDQKDNAIESYNKLLAADPSNTEAKMELASLLLSSNKIEEARKMLSEVDLSGVTNPYTIYNLGVGMYNAQLPDEAIKYWEKTVALDPSMTDAYMQMGFAYYSIKNTAKAKEAFQKVIEIEPDSENAKSAQEMLSTIQ